MLACTATERRRAKVPHNAELSMRFNLACVTLFGAIAIAQTATGTTADDQQKTAKRACLAGDYATGVRILADLFVDSNDPTYLFNQGRCYEQNVRYEEAIGRFNEYLRKAPNLTAAERADTEAHVAACEAALGRRAAPVSEIAVTTPTPTPAPVRPWQVTAGWVASGVAAVALGFGIVEHVRYAGKGNDFNDLASQGRCNDAAPDKGGPSCASLADSQDTAAVLAGLGYGTAALAAGTAVYLWLSAPAVGPGGSHATRRVVCLPGVAGVSCGGQF